jgi:hypothetical protein
MPHQTFKGMVDLQSGVDSHSVNTFNMPQPPTSGRADIMKGGPGAANMGATCDFTSLSVAGGTFHFPTIPSDGFTYRLVFTFEI